MYEVVSKTSARCKNGIQTISTYHEYRREWRYASIKHMKVDGTQNIRNMYEYLVRKGHTKLAQNFSKQKNPGRVKEVRKKIRGTTLDTNITKFQGIYPIQKYRHLAHQPTKTQNKDPTNPASKDGWIETRYQKQDRSNGKTGQKAQVLRFIQNIGIF